MTIAKIPTKPVTPTYEIDEIRIVTCRNRPSTGFENTCNVAFLSKGETIEEKEVLHLEAGVEYVATRCLEKPKKGIWGRFCDYALTDDMRL